MIEYRISNNEYRISNIEVSGWREENEISNIEYRSVRRERERKKKQKITKCQIVETIHIPFHIKVLVNPVYLLQIQ
jgi:hypothetical protein